MVNKILLPLGFIAVGIFCIYPYLMGQESAKLFKMIAAVICFGYGIGSLIYNLLKK